MRCGSGKTVKNRTATHPHRSKVLGFKDPKAQLRFLFCELQMVRFGVDFTFCNHTVRCGAVRRGFCFAENPTVRFGAVLLKAE